MAKLKKIKLLFIIILSLSTIGCGQKGPLYLPKNNPDVIF